MNTDLSELNPLGSLTLGGGQSKMLGTPYIPVFPAFGVEPDHLQFEYSTAPPDGRSVVGFVEYHGTRVNNDLIVTVNPTTGQAQLKNDSPFTIAIDGYSIYSDSGSLAACERRLVQPRRSRRGWLGGSVPDDNRGCGTELGRQPGA